jgi:hypothetical protein
MTAKVLLHVVANAVALVRAVIANLTTALGFIARLVAERIGTGWVPARGMRRGAVLVHRLAVIGRLHPFTLVVVAFIGRRLRQIRATFVHWSFSFRQVETHSLISVYPGRRSSQRDHVGHHQCASDRNDPVSSSCGLACHTGQERAFSLAARPVPRGTGSASLMNPDQIRVDTTFAREEFVED